MLGRRSLPDICASQVSSNGGCLCRAREEAKVEPYSEIYEEEPTPFDEMYKEASVFGSEVRACA